MTRSTMCLWSIRTKYNRYQKEDMKTQHSHQLNIMFHTDALDLLNKLAPSPKSKGDFLMRLLYEYEATLAERTRFREIINVADKTLGELSRTDTVGQAV